MNDNSKRPAIALSEWSNMKGVSLATAKSWAKSKKIDAWKSGRDWLISPSEFSPYDIDLVSERPPDCHSDDCYEAGVCPCECGYCHDHCPDKLQISDDDNYDSIELSEDGKSVYAHYRAVSVELMLVDDRVVDNQIRLSSIPMDLAIDIHVHRSVNEALEIFFPIVHLLSRLDRTDFRILDNEPIIL